MPKTASARRYAQAVFEIALEGGDLEVWTDDLTALARALENEEFARLLDAPQVAAPRKVEVIKESMGGSMGALAQNLLCLLATRNLTHLVPAILDQFERLLDVRRGIERAEVVSAVSLNAEHQQQIEEILRGITGKEIRLTARVEPGILGGLVARVGDSVIDGSTRTKLGAMRRELVERPP